MDKFVVRKRDEADVADAHLADGTVIHDLDGGLFGTGSGNHRRKQLHHGRAFGTVFRHRPFRQYLDRWGPAKQKGVLGNRVALGARERITLSRCRTSG